MNITVYCGSSPSEHESHRQAARELGTWIGAHGHRLVYGGSSVGIMGILADAVLAAGGEVTGVEPTFMIERELQHDGITKLIAVDTMAERMTTMVELGQAFIALPGGVGTLEEISEIASRIRLNLTQAPCIFYNVEGFYDNLQRFFGQMQTSGYLSTEDLARITFAQTLSEVVTALA